MTIPDEVLAPLTPTERWAVRFVWRANRGLAHRCFSVAQRVIGPIAVGLVAGRRTHVRGVEHVLATDPARPVLLVSNHRSWFDFPVIARALCTETDRLRGMQFPVRGRFFFETVRGVAINALASQFSMFPPFFTRTETRDFDRWALEYLASRCRDGAGRFVGFHPEGRRNLDEDEWSLLPAQPGIGQLIHLARPQVLPVWVTGMSNDVIAQFRANVWGPERARVRFGAALDLTTLCDAPPRVRSYAAIARAVMDGIAAVGGADRAEFGRPSA